MNDTIDNVVAVEIDDEMKQSYLDYAMSVIVGRALPDVRDGLKPVQRRVVYAMYREGLLSNRRFSKCAGVVGEVLKKYHPHGDSSVYDALVRLAQSWSLRYPLVDGQGNFGSIDGDPPAAYRYTECRMTKISEQLLNDIDKQTVDFIPNFDDSQQEPTVLPTLLPNLLINGATGIAVGMATHMPPHNLNEVIDGAIALIRNPDLNTYQLMTYVEGPDFPTGGTICGRSGIFQAYDTGRGSISVRATIQEEDAKNGVALVVTEIPYMVNKSKLIERIAQLVNSKQIEGISRLRDESDRKGMRIVIELKRDATAEVVQSQLYKLTPLQSNFSVINLAIVEGKQIVLTLKEILNHFINFRREIVARSTEFDLKKAKERLHILEGYRIALANLDEIIKLIRRSENASAAKEGLINTYGLSHLQATAILELRLQKLTSMEQVAVESEYQDVVKNIAELQALLLDNTLIDKCIVEQLEQIRDNYGDGRKTLIEEESSDISLEDLIEDSNAVITISNKGYIKRTSLDEYRTQRRGGKGVSGTANRDDEFTESMFVASSHTVLMFITSAGRTFCLKVYELPESGRVSRGRALVNLLQLREDEVVCAVVPIRDFSDDKFLMIATKNGLIKKTPLSDFKRMRKVGLNTIGVRDNDIVIGAQIVGDKDDLMLSVNSGMAIRFACVDIRSTGRGAQGVKGIDLGTADSVVSVTVVPHDEFNIDEDRDPEIDDGSEDLLPDDGIMLVTVCEAGFGKKTPISKYRVQNRGGKDL